MFKYSERADYEMMNQRYREGKFCEKTSVKDLYRVDDVMFRKCSGNFVDLNSSYLVEAFNSYEKGVMPFPGGYMEQPHKILDCFRVIGIYKTTKLIEQQKKAASKQKAMSRGR